jgi:hypothetical protein
VQYSLSPYEREYCITPYFALLVVAYGANSVEVTPTLISVDLFVRDMSLVLAPLPDFISTKRDHIYF